MTSLLIAPSSIQIQSPLQSQVDDLVGGFLQNATDWRSLAAMMAGGMAYRMGRIGTLSVGVQNFEPLRRLASVGIGLGTEVTAFEMTNRSLASLTRDTRSNPNLWRWEGQGGIRQGLLTSLITFGSLKGAGKLAQGENAIVQHLLQDTGMVLGHQMSGAFGITPRPTGSLAEQFLHAEVTNLQLSAGMALAHSVAPGIQGLERGLNLSLRETEIPPTSLWQRGARGDLAFATTGRRGTLETSDPRDHIFPMAAQESDPPSTPGGTPAKSSSPSLPQPIYSSRFQGCWEDLKEQHRSVGRKALQLLFDYYRDGILPKGLGLKKLGGGREEFHEIRISQSHRILFRKNDGWIEFLFIGGHKELKQIVRRSDVGEDLSRGADPHFDPLKIQSSEAVLSPLSAERSASQGNERLPAPPSNPRSWSVEKKKPTEEAPESIPPPVSPLEELLSSPFPSHLKADYPEVDMVEPETLHRAAAEEWARPFVRSEGRTALQLLTFLRQIRHGLDGETQRRLEILEEEALTHPEDLPTVTHWAFQQYEGLRQNLISQIPLDLTGLFPEIRGEGPPLEGREAGISLQKLLSQSRLSEDLQETLNRFMDEALQSPNPILTYLKRAAVLFLENPERVLKSPPIFLSDRNSVRTTFERDFPELNAMEIHEVPPLPEALPALTEDATARVREFWTRKDSELLSKAWTYSFCFLRNRPEWVEITRLFHRISMFAAAGSSQPELAAQGTADLFSLYQEKQRAFFSALLESPEGVDLLGRLPEILKADLEPSSTWEREEFRPIKGDPFETLARISTLILSHPRLRTRWEETFWKTVAENETKGPRPAGTDEVRARVRNLSQRLLEFYAQHRNELRQIPERRRDPVSAHAEALNAMEEQLPWRFGEISFFSDEILKTKRERIEDFINDPEPADFIFRFSLPSGINGEFALPFEAAENMKINFEMEGRILLPLPGSHESLEINREGNVEFFPVTSQYRLRLLLETRLPPQIFRMFRLTMDVEGPWKEGLNQDLTQATYLLLLGFPLPWTVRQASERMVRTYEAHRKDFFVQLEKERPRVFSEIIQKLPDGQLIDAMSFLGLLSHPKQSWPPDLKKAIDQFNQTLNSSPQLGWQSADDFAANLAETLTEFYLLHRQEFLKAMGITGELRNLMGNFHEVFSQAKMPELYQIAGHALGMMNDLFKINLPAYNPRSLLHQIHLRAFILCTWKTLPTRLRADFDQFLGAPSDRERMSYRTIMRSLQFYRENRERILPHLPLLN